MTMEIDEIKTLIDLMNDNGLVEIEMEEKGRKIRLVKEGTSPRELVAVQTQIPTMIGQAGVESAAAAENAEESGLYEVTAPMVGTLYRAPSPDSAPFVDVGMKVTEDTTVCIIEAMKVMNEIRAEVSGTIVEVLVENAHPVEYGQPLFKIKVEE